MTIGAVIRTLRASAGLQQKELAARVGISASFLSLLERNKREPTVRILRDIGRALGIPPGVLVAVALQDEDAGSSLAALRVAESINNLVQAAHHYVVAERLTRGDDEDDSG